MKKNFAVKVLIVFELFCVWQYTLLNSIEKYTKQKKTIEMSNYCTLAAVTRFYLKFCIKSRKSGFRELRFY